VWLPIFLFPRGDDGGSERSDWRMTPNTVSLVVGVLRTSIPAWDIDKKFDFRCPDKERLRGRDGEEGEEGRAGTGGALAEGAREPCELDRSDENEARRLNFAKADSLGCGAVGVGVVGVEGVVGVVDSGGALPTL
jgi:hypothetical protein